MPMNNYLMNEFPMKLIKYISQILTFTFIFSIIAYIIINRLIIREDITLPYNFDKTRFILFMCFMLFVIIILLIVLLNKNLIIKNPFYSRIQTSLNKNLDIISIFVFNNVMMYKIPDIYLYLKNKNNFLFLLYVILSCLIRFIVLMFFTIDIFIFGKISYFYKILPLLLIPLIFRICYYFFKRFLEMQYEILAPKIEAKYNQEFIETKDYVIKAAVHRIKNSDKIFDGYISLNVDYFYAVQEQIGKKINAQKSLEKFDKGIELMIEQQMVLSNFELRKSIIEPLFTLLIRTCYFIIWSYVLYINDPATFFEIVNFIGNIYKEIKNPFSNIESFEKKDNENESDN
jgi:hypothetical protein